MKLNIQEILTKLQIVLNIRNKHQNYRIYGTNVKCCCTVRVFDLFVDWHCSSPGLSCPWILQARTREGFCALQDLPDLAIESASPVAPALHIINLRLLWLLHCTCIIYR